MWATSADFLNMALGIGFLVLVVFLCMFLLYAILILRDFSKVSEDIEEMVSRVHKTITEPLKAVDFLIEKAKPYFEAMVDKGLKNVTKSRSKKS